MPTVIEERLDGSDRVTVVDYRGRTRFAQIVVGLAGIALTVLGAVALIRAGLPVLEGEQAHATVGAFHRTGWMGLIELILGVSLLASAGTALDTLGARGVGVVAAIFGIIVLIEPAAFHGVLGIHSLTGLTYLIGGAVIAAVTSFAVYRAP